ncbi:hypothetical protein O181_069621 [Austropuccinia psidii MF-1]|uniref:Uncharacterized protein n=1 Tax=Austropuccinia psidii MF-1 TaxID=1389203 RepID=A0A9Q3EX43_9BASI|nr:hypothetical protein [Austropuccinia psidii MF-1]
MVGIIPLIGSAIYVKGPTKFDRAVLLISIDGSDPEELNEYSIYETERWWVRKLKSGNHSFLAWKPNNSSFLQQDYVAFEVVIVTSEKSDSDRSTDIIWIIAFGCVLLISFALAGAYKCAYGSLSCRTRKKLDYDWGESVIDASTVKLPFNRFNPISSPFNLIIPVSPPPIVNSFSKSSDALKLDNLEDAKICQAKMVNLPNYSKSIQSFSSSQSGKLPMLPTKTFPVEKSAT